MVFRIQFTDGYVSKSEYLLGSFSYKGAVLFWGPKKGT